MRIRITADSTCDLTKELAPDVAIIPLHIVTDSGDKLDGIDIAPDDIYADVAAGHSLPKTSAINIAEYREFFEQELSGADAVVHINIGSEFSCCHKNACLAAEGLPVTCIDSGNLSIGQGIVALRAREWAEDGATVEEIARRAGELLPRVDASFIIERLDYLRAGGRCSSVTALGANLLRLRPCIEVADGKMRVGKKYRGAYERCVTQYINERASRPGVEMKRLIMAHSGIPKETMDLYVATAREALPFDRIDVVRAGCTITSHCGPNTVGMFLVSE